ncbi:hypothetical protein [Streptomyces kanamyceticus]|uniref:hypothetical protein n=1 Tax=Streptomyces kanamyceticus TaxID=1967 RepID=UPI00123CF517|nr:hypothetical protein [Streptomyces kanamyceticus]
MGDIVPTSELIFGLAGACIGTMGTLLAPLVQEFLTSNRRKSEELEARARETRQHMFYRLHVLRDCTRMALFAAFQSVDPDAVSMRANLSTLRRIDSSHADVARSLSRRYPKVADNYFAFNRRLEDFWHEGFRTYDRVKMRPNETATRDDLEQLGAAFNELAEKRDALVAELRAASDDLGFPNFIGPGVPDEDYNPTRF